MTPDIRLADLHNPDHGRDILYLLDAYARDPMGGGEPMSEFARTHLIDRLSKRTDVSILLAYCDGKAAGIAICIEGFSTFACAPLLNIHDFAIAPEFRGRGLGRGLLAAVEARARELGCCKLTLEVLDGNAPARQLYVAAGYAGYELNAAMGTAIFMQKKLAPL